MVDEDYSLVGKFKQDGVSLRGNDISFLSVDNAGSLITILGDENTHSIVHEKVFVFMVTWNWQHRLLVTK